MESHIVLPVMKLPGIRFRPCPVQIPPITRAIAPTVIKVMRPLPLVMFPRYSDQLTRRPVEVSLAGAEGAMSSAVH